MMQVIIHYYGHVLIMCLDPTWFNRGYFIMIGFHVVYRGFVVNHEG